MAAYAITRRDRAAERLDPPVGHGLPSRADRGRRRSLDHTFSGGIAVGRY